MVMREFCSRYMLSRRLEAVRMQGSYHLEEGAQGRALEFVITNESCHIFLSPRQER
jgi:hypothetical protein